MSYTDAGTQDTKGHTGRQDTQDAKGHKKETADLADYSLRKDGGLLLSRIALQYHRRRRA